MLSFEFKIRKELEIPDELEIYLDNEGLHSLLEQLQALSNGRTDHVHLMCEEWGGTHLDDQAQQASNAVIKHVKVLMR